MGTLFYGIALALVSMNLIWFVVTKRKTESSLFVAMYVLMVVASMGYLYLSLSTSLEEALLATKILYIGAEFIPFVMLAILTRFLKLKIHRTVMGVGVLLAFAYFIVITIFVKDGGVFYQSATLQTFNGSAYLEKEYGPLHAITFIYSAIYMVMMIATTSYAFTKLKTVSYKNLLLIVATILIVMVFSFISKSIHPAFDLMPYAYAAGGFIMLELIHRSNTYDIDYATTLNIANKEFYGCAAFDLSGNYLGCNAAVYKLHPELELQNIDRPLKQGNLKTILDQLFKGVDDPNIDPFIHIDVGDRCYLYTLQRNKRHKKDYGYFLSIEDDTEQMKYVHLLENYSEELKAAVEEKTKHIQEIQGKIILAMADIVETRDESTGGHVKRTSALVNIITNSIKKLGVYQESNEFFINVMKAAPMHDLGKITISNEILNKPGRFTPEEFEIMKTHSAMGEKMVGVVLEGVQDEYFVKIAKNIARFHHEKYGGGGYPDNLSGEDIPVEARIMALADVYDALVSKRVYKEAMPFDKAATIIRESMGPHFDPKLAPVFEDCREQLEQYFIETGNR